MAGANTGWVFVGTAKTKPRISIRRSIKPIQNDIGGDAPFDLLSSGQEAIISADINRMSLTAYFGMAQNALPGLIAPPATFAGIETPGLVGTLLVTEGQAFQLAVVFPYAAKLAYQNVANGALIGGYIFAAATLESPDDIDPGTQDMTIHMIWHAVRVHAPASQAGINTFTSILYTVGVPAGLPAPT